MITNHEKDAAKAYAEIVSKGSNTFEEHIFPGRDVGLGVGEYVIVTYKRRKIEGMEGSVILPEVKKLDERQQ